MAKYERRLVGNFDAVLRLCETTVMQGSLTASYEGGSDVADGDLRVAVRVFERYSGFSGSRVSLNLTLVGGGEQLFLSAIASGGSRAVLFKLDTVGETNFLETLRAEVEKQYPVQAGEGDFA
ncbi:MAG: hypothetical protein GXX99_02980 [Clostridiales bacterium]|nr:hypothetical protein [Clostridiales bacterium]